MLFALFYVNMTGTGVVMLPYPGQYGAGLVIIIILAVKTEAMASLVPIPWFEELTRKGSINVSKMKMCLHFRATSQYL